MSPSVDISAYDAISNHNMRDQDEDLKVLVDGKKHASKHGGIKHAKQGGGHTRLRSTNIEEMLSEGPSSFLARKRKSAVRDDESPDLEMAQERERERESKAAGIRMLMRKHKESAR